MKKFMSLLICTMLLFGFHIDSFSLIVNAQVDTIKPELKSISLDKKSVIPGESVGITVDASDEGSGIRTVDVYYSSPVTSKTKSVRLTLGEDGKYRGQLAMTSNDESGTWIIYHVSIYDNMGNYLEIYNLNHSNVLSSWNKRDFSEYNFELNGTQVDTVKPVLKNISLDKKSVIPGESVGITIDTSDEGSGIRTVDVYYSSPVTSKTKSVHLTLGEDGKYRGQLAMTSNDESGTWIIYYVSIYDNMGNYLTTYNSNHDKVLYSWNKRDFSEYNFELNGTQVDTVKPVLKNISLDKKSVLPWESVGITVDASDEGSGIRTVDVYYSSPVTSKTKSVRLTLGEDGKYRGQLAMTSNDESGTWIIYYVSIYDNMGNYLTTYNSNHDKVLYSWNKKDFSDYNFDLIEDDRVPIFEKIESTSFELDDDSFQSFTVFTSDNSKLMSVDATFANESDETMTLSSTNVTTDGFNMELPRSAFPKEAATWKLQSLRIKDMNGNETTVTEGLSFTIKTLALITPIDARIVTSNEKWTNTIVNQDVYIMPGVTLTLGQGTVLNGKVYVGGRLWITGGVKAYEQIRASYFITGYYTPSQDGMVVISGSNLVYSKAATNQLYDTLPFELEATPVFEKDGMVSISGSFIPLSTLYLNGEPLQTKANGTFRVDMKAPKDRTLRFSMTDVYGKIHRWSYRVYNTDAPIVTATLDSGIYLKGQTVELTTTDGTIHVTRNDESSVYEGPFTLDKTVSLSIYAKDEIDRTSETIPRRYEVMTIDPVTNRDMSIQGTAEPGTHVTLSLGANISTVTTDETGRFVFHALRLTNESMFSVQATHGMLTSDVWTRPIQDVIAPIVTGVSHDQFYAQPVSFTFNEGTAMLNGNVVTSPVRVETDGTYELVVKDEANNQTTMRFVLDQKAPVLTGVPNGVTNQVVTPTFNEGVALLNGETFTSGQSITTDGVYTLVVRDKAGNETRQSFKIDRTPPVVSEVKNGFFNRDITPVFLEGTALLNDKPFESGTILTKEGVYDLVVKDEAGNVTKITFTIDKTAVKVLGVTEGDTYPSAHPTFSEGEATLNGKPFSSSQAITSDGDYTLMVTDRAGNQTVVHFTIDTRPPVLSGLTKGKTHYREVVPLFTEGAATLNGQPFVSGTRISREGVYTLRLVDAIGNETVATFTIDRTRPIVTGVTANQLTNQTVTIRFNEGTATLNGKAFRMNTQVGASGKYALRVTDAAGNYSSISFAIDKVGPTKPTVLTLTNKSTRVTGKTEAGATVLITYNGRTYTTKASTAGTYSYNLKTTKAGATVTVRAKDAAGNLSTAVSSKVLNTFATFTVNTVKSSATSVTGKGNKTATVQAFVGTKAISKTAKVDSKGYYKLTIPRQKAGVTVTVKMKQTGYLELKKVTKVVK
ncbi:Ig-like domain-containing protein [Exiguobacterium sp. E.TIA.1]|uniref:Ig-like domain-containing protein n=2 Tax=unclassified Exiguobacterium TaxID=2644629 RepID=UPI001BE7AD37